MKISSQDPGSWLSKKCETGLVSVVVPSYNRAHLITETLDSVVAQTYRPIELIVVDDGSEDDTAKVVDTWRAGHDAVRGLQVHFHPRPHFGTSAAWNWGLQDSRGEFIQLLDSDDLLSPNKIERQLAAGLGTSAALCGPWEWLRRGSSGWVAETPDRRMEIEGDLVEQWLAGKYFPLHSMLWPRGTLERLKKWDETLETFHDADLFIRAVLLGCKFLYVPDTCVYYRVGFSPNSGSNKRSLASLRSRVKVFDCVQEELKKRGELDKHIPGLARSYYSLARTYACILPEEAQRCYERFLALSPNGRVPGSLANHLATRLLGVVRKEKLSRKLQALRGGSAA